MADQIKIERANAKRALTNKISYIRRLINEDNFDDLNNQSLELKTLFHSFEDKHVEYCNAVEEDKELLVEEEYFIKEQNRYSSTLHQIKLNLPDQDKKPLLNAQKLDQSMASANDEQTTENHLKELIDKISRPKLQIPIFSGDPLSYSQFTRSFELNVEATCGDDESAKLSLLLQS